MDGEQYILISALNHYAFCPRRCYLIHHEGLFEENAFTTEGRILHDRVDSGARTVRAGVVEHRRVPLVSHRLKLRGIADLIEETAGVLRPVEYKRGGRKVWDNDDIQVCAQAMCLEEMLGVTALTEGAIFHAKTGRRRTVPLTDELRRATEAAVAAVRELLDTGVDPGSVYSRRCEGCSLYRVCLPVETALLRAARLDGLETGEEDFT